MSGLWSSLLALGAIVIGLFLIFVLITLILVSPWLLIIVVPTFWYVFKPLFEKHKTALDD